MHLYDHYTKEEKESEVIEKRLPALTSLLEEFKLILVEPKSLPPSMQHDHKIPLIEGSQAINQRSYRVPYIHMVKIEQQIKEILKTGIIQ